LWIAAFDVWLIMPEPPNSGKRADMSRLLHQALLLPIASAAASPFAGPAIAQDCAPEPQGDGRVVAAIDARTIRLADGRIVRLAGLAPMRPVHEPAARSALAALAVGHEVALNAADDIPDRYGRQEAFVFAEGAAQPLQADLIATGYGVRAPGLQDRGCRDLLAAAENRAAAGRHGVWNAPLLMKNIARAEDISREIGHFIVVEAALRSVRQTAAVTYLNFGRRRGEGLTAIVPARALPTFEQADKRLSGFEGRHVRVRGYLLDRGGPRIELLSPDQIEIVGGGAAASPTGD
jgi:endonuclease YncB( thermonuclease family)